jgi:hypothetical protein
MHGQDSADKQTLEDTSPLPDTVRCSCYVSPAPALRGFHASESIDSLFSSANMIGNLLVIHIRVQFPYYTLGEHADFTTNFYNLLILPKLVMFQKAVLVLPFRSTSPDFAE